MYTWSVLNASITCSLILSGVSVRIMTESSKTPGCKQWVLKLLSEWSIAEVFPLPWAVSIAANTVWNNVFWQVGQAHLWRMQHCSCWDLFLTNHLRNVALQDFLVMFSLCPTLLRKYFIRKYFILHWLIILLLQKTCQKHFAFLLCR